MKMLCCLELKILGVEKDGYARRKIGIKALKKTRLGVDYVRNRFHVAVRLFYYTDPWQHGINLFYTMIRKEKKTDTQETYLPRTS